MALEEAYHHYQQRYDHSRWYWPAATMRWSNACNFLRKLTGQRLFGKLPPMRLLVTLLLNLQATLRDDAARSYSTPRADYTFLTSRLRCLPAFHALYSKPWGSPIWAHPLTAWAYGPLHYPSYSHIFPPYNVTASSRCGGLASDAYRPGYIVFRFLPPHSLFLCSFVSDTGSRAQ